MVDEFAVGIAVAGTITLDFAARSAWIKAKVMTLARRIEAGR
jgi:hypothetical protein